MTLFIQGGDILTPKGPRPNHTLVIEGQRIAAILPNAQATARPSDPSINAAGHLVAPGLIDMHIHGAAGHDVMDASPQALRAIARFLAQHGVTAFMPTTISAAHTDLLHAIRNVNALAQEPPAGARILGVHLEGPYLNPAKAGAQPTAHIRPPNLAELDTYQRAGPLKHITLAPEMPGAEALARQSRRRGLTLGLGHTDASYEQTLTAVRWGLTHVTHTFNAMSGPHQRRPAAVGAALTCNELYTEIIADGIHVHPAMVELLIRAKGVERTILISDACRAAGLPDGQYELGGQPVSVRAGVSRLADGTLAGSTLTLDTAVRHVMQISGLSLAQTLPMAASTPAASLGMALGSLAPGRLADVTLWDENAQVALTLVGGQVVYRAGADPTPVLQ